jgi:hypothetical protein
MKYVLNMFRIRLVYFIVTKFVSKYVFVEDIEYTLTTIWNYFTTSNKKSLYDTIFPFNVKFDIE